MGSLIRLGFFKSSGVAATPGYFIADTPWAGVKSNSAWNTRVQGSGMLSGGRYISDNVQNNSFTTDHYFAAGTYKVALIYLTNTDHGIYNITGISGTQTIDSYAASDTSNNYAEVTGIAVTAGVKSVQTQMATKNASSTGYNGRLQTVAFVRTGA